MATEYTADLIASLRQREQELREERAKIVGALLALTAGAPVRRASKTTHRQRPAPFTMRRTPTR